MVLENKMKEIWLLDDEENNHRSFAQRHSGFYHLVSFYKPEELLSALRENRKPDLLLLDGYFLKEESKGYQALQTEWKEIFAGLDDYGKRYEQKYQPLGIETAQGLINHRVPFPFMMYSAKAPFILRGEEYSGYACLGEGFILKDVEEVSAERQRIDSTIERFHRIRDMEGLRRSRRIIFVLMLVFFALFTLTGGILLGLVLESNLWFSF